VVVVSSGTLVAGASVEEVADGEEGSPTVLSVGIVVVVVPVEGGVSGTVVGSVASVLVGSVAELGDSLVDGAVVACVVDVGSDGVVVAGGIDVGASVDVGSGTVVPVEGGASVELDSTTVGSGGATACVVAVSAVVVASVVATAVRNRVGFIVVVARRANAPAPSRRVRRAPSDYALASAPVPSSWRAFGGLRTTCRTESAAGSDLRRSPRIARSGARRARIAGADRPVGFPPVPAKLRGKWALGITPRNFTWIIKDKLAICERPGGYGDNHRRVRRQEEIIWIRENGFGCLVSIIAAPSNLHNYDELGVTYRHRPLGPADDLDTYLRVLYPELRDLLADNVKIVVHGEEVGDRLLGIMGGFIRWSGLVEDGSQAITVSELIARHQLDPSARALILRVHELR